MGEPRMKFNRKNMKRCNFSVISEFSYLGIPCYISRPIQLFVMRKLLCSSLCLVSLLALSLRGQAQDMSKLTIKPVNIRDASDNPIPVPQLGKKHLLIFYVDPDHASQNKEFIDNLEKNQILSDEIYSFGIVNLKDAPMLPNGIVRSMIRKKIKQTGADIYTDPGYFLRDGWNLGDVNNQFALIFVTKNLEVKFFSKGELTPEQIKEFYRVIDEYK